MRFRGTDHPIIVAPTMGRVIVRIGDEVIAESRHAVTLTEASYPGVQYIPRADVRMDLLRRTPQTTHCPYKGYASYYTVSAESRTALNAVWSYEDPFSGIDEIAGRLAFHASKVDIVMLTGNLGQAVGGGWRPGATRHAATSQAVIRAPSRADTAYPLRVQGAD